MREQVLPQLRNHQLRRRRKQIDLDEIEERLKREQQQQTGGNAIQQRLICRDECSVQEVSNDLRKRERDASAQEQAHERHHQPPHVRPHPRQQSAERARRRYRLGCTRSWPLGANRERRRRSHANNTFRSITIAMKSNARYSSENL